MTVVKTTMPKLPAGLVGPALSMDENAPTVRNRLRSAADSLKLHL